MECIIVPSIRPLCRDAEQHSAESTSCAGSFPLHYNSRLDYCHKPHGIRLLAPWSIGDIMLSMTRHSHEEANAHFPSLDKYIIGPAGVQ